MKRRIHLDAIVTTGTFARNAAASIRTKLSEYDTYVRDVDATAIYDSISQTNRVLAQARLNQLPDGDRFRDWLRNLADNPRVLSGSRISLHGCRHEEVGTSWPACVEDDVWVKP